MSFRRILRTAFIGGELDPLLEGRIDTEQHALGLSVCENFVPINEGPLIKRQGFEYVAPAQATGSWLTGFRPSIEQEYVIEWGEQNLRFFTNGEPLESAPGEPFELAVPYPALRATQLCAQQSIDRQYLAHWAFPPAALRRDTPNSFSFEILDLIDGPFLDRNFDEGQTIQSSGTTGSVVLTANVAQFEEGHVGSKIRIEAKDFADIPQWEPQMKGVTVGNVVRNEGKVYTALTAGITGSKEPTHTEGAYFDGLTKNDELNDKGPYGIKWQYRHDRFGIVKITAVNSPTEASGTVERRLPDSLTSVASYRFAFQAFSAALGWPSLVTLYKGRLIFFKDLDIIGSVAGDYGGGRINFAQFSESGLPEPDLAFRRTLGSENAPLWVSGDRSLLVGTASQELAIAPINSSAAFSGGNIDATPQSYYGSDRVFPLRIGTETLFVERGGRRIRAADYEFGRDRYDAIDLTAASRHITSAGIVQLAQQRVPYHFVIGVRGDGQLVVHPKTRGEIKAMVRFRLGGDARALSAVSVVGADGKTEDLWLLVERRNGAGEGVREIWRQVAWRDANAPLTEAFFVDGGKRIEVAAGVGTIPGLVHLAGQEVAVLANGIVFEGLTVGVDGVVTLPSEQVPPVDYVAIVGLGYTATAQTMRADVRDGKGGIAGLRMRVRKAIFGVLDTLGLRAGAPGGPADELILRAGETHYDKAVPLANRDIEGEIDSDYTRDGRVRWISSRPLPAKILLAILDLEVSDADA